MGQTQRVGNLPPLSSLPFFISSIIPLTKGYIYRLLPQKSLVGRVSVPALRAVLPVFDWMRRQRPLMARVNCSTKQHSRSNSCCSPSFVAILRDGGDLGLPSEHGKKRLLRMLLVSPVNPALMVDSGSDHPIKNRKSLILT